MVTSVAGNGVVYIKSDALGMVRHGFSTRLGGVSVSRETQWLNLRRGMGDSDAVVLENLSLFSHALGIQPDTVVSAHQVHSCDVRVVGREHHGSYYSDSATQVGECDGLVTAQPMVALAVASADCMPILLHEPDAGIIGALHAGWRGTVAGIAAKGVEAILSLGGRADRIRAALGPSIRQCCFEVGDNVRDAARTLSADLAERFFADAGDGKYMCDLAGMNAEILRRSGLAEENIDVCDYCTACNGDLFYSHRLSGRARGTMLAMISM